MFNCEKIKALVFLDKIPIGIKLSVKNPQFFGQSNTGLNPRTCL